MYTKFLNFNIPSFDKSDLAFGAFAFLSVSCGILSYYYTSETLKQTDEYCNQISYLKNSQQYLLYQVDILKNLNQQTVYKMHDLMLNVNASILNKKYDMQTQTDTNLCITTDTSDEIIFPKTYSNV